VKSLSNFTVTLVPSDFVMCASYTAPSASVSTRSTVAPGTALRAAGERADAEDLLDIAVPETRVVVEPDSGPFTTAFDVHAFPTFLRVRDGMVAARGLAVSEVADPVRG
jgi:hypothetical protein